MTEFRGTSTPGTRIIRIERMTPISHANPVRILTRKTGWDARDVFEDMPGAIRVIRP
jgi:hypothetical protein